jgi:hypothetical protein
VQIIQITEHFAAMIPVTIGVNAVTGSDWEGTGILPDSTTDPALTLFVAHKMALTQLKQIRPRPEIDVDYDMIIGDIETDMASLKE